MPRGIDSLQASRRRGGLVTCEPLLHGVPLAVPGVRPPVHANPSDSPHLSSPFRHVRDAQPSSEIAQRRNLAGRVGFLLGILAALIAVTLNLLRAPRPLSLGVVLLSVLIAALNIPLGIGLALLVERLSRGESER